MENTNGLASVLAESSESDSAADGHDTNGNMKYVS